MTQISQNLVGSTRRELEELALSAGHQAYRGRQLYRGIYSRLLRDFRCFTDLDRGFREFLAAHCEVRYLPVARELTSRDQSIRYLLGLEDGNSIEAVCMPWRMERRQGRQIATPSGREPAQPAGADNLQEDASDPRTTLCISSQVGCAVGCRFCFTGLLGATRNLSPAEIVGQVLTIAAIRGLWANPAESRPDQAPGERSQAANPRAAPRVNVVFMGQGEPLLNLESVQKAVQIMADPAACGIPLRRITISTAGIVPRIYDLAREPLRPKLAISLNASNDEQRDLLMPINRKYPLSVLLEACRAYPLRPRERLTFEYVMLDGINDSREDARRVADLLNGIAARVNLIPYNGGTSLPYRPSPLERVYAFESVLRGRDIPTFIRISRGQDIMAACGQLSLAS